MAGLFKTSVARKVAMALSALFLILFLIIHLAVNLTSVISEYYRSDDSSVFRSSLMGFLGRRNELQIHTVQGARPYTLLSRVNREISRTFTCGYVCALLCIFVLTLATRLSVSFSINGLEGQCAQKTD